MLNVLKYVTALGYHKAYCEMDKKMWLPPPSLAGRQASMKNNRLHSSAESLLSWHGCST